MKNQLFYGKDKVRADSIVNWCKEYISEYTTANQSKDMADSGDVVPHLILWKPFVGGSYKFNIDAAIDVCHLRVGLNMVIRDHTGFMMASSAQRINAIQIVEVLAILRGLVFTIESGLLPVVVESDTLEVVNMINFGSHIHAEVCLVIGDIREFQNFISSGYLNFISRKANTVAHNLSNEANHFWMESCPPCVEG
ncbi:hypothetical protein Ddye_023312 [Dipteronia dyeriana]|uniref:RNase H type-1 domain-containing protein n=1 Tax=Dipteronia dyeriana TaxID=168575 RepID=A0AAD9WS07_9ROSI|nr:hypothetical protein Ddye_023312 [Dipteronia dyeriana]